MFCIITFRVCGLSISKFSASQDSQKSVRSGTRFLERCLNDIEILESRGGVKYQHFVGRLDPSLCSQAAERSDASRSFWAEKNSFGSTNAGNFSQHFVITNAQGGATALTQH